MSPSTPTPTLISSVRRALVLLEVVAEHGEITAKRLSRETRLPLPTTYHLLRTLVHDGYLVRERGSFRLGPAVPRLSRREPGAEPGVRLAEWLGVHSAVGFSLPVSERARLAATAERLRERLARALTTQAFTVLT